jgi:hypothetical protein
VAKWPITKGQQCGVNYISNIKVTFKLNLQFGAHTVSRLSRLQPPVCLKWCLKEESCLIFFLSYVDACSDAALPLKNLSPLPLLHPGKLKQQHGFLSMLHHSHQPPLLSVNIN